MNQSKQKLKTQQKKKQITGESMTIKKDLKDYNYDILSKTELIKQIRNKDRCIAQLQQGINNKGNSESDKVNMYRLKLEDEIAQNQKAVKAFGSITEIIISIITKFKGSDMINKEVLTGVMKILEQPKQILEKSVQQDEQDSESQYSCFDEIVDETLKLLQHLSLLTQQNLNTNLKLKTDLNKAKSELQKRQALISLPLPVKKQAEQQINLLKQEVNQIILENKDLKKVLLQNQQQKNKLLKSISTALTEQQILELTKQNIQQLIQRIRRMTYRIKQLQKDKKDIFIKAKVEKQSDQKKFQDLLNQVKQIRVNKKLSLSVQ